MRTASSAWLRASFGFAVVLAATVACADKSLTTPKGVAPSRISLRVMATASQVATLTPRYVWVGVAAVLPGADTGILAMANAPITGGTVTVPLDVDLSPCLAANSAAGRSGCSIIVGVSLRADSISRKDTVDGDPFTRAFDYQLAGPFDVSSGKAPNIPPFDLSVSRFAAIDFVGDEALRLGSAQNIVNATGSRNGRAIAGVPNGAGDPVLFAVSVGFNFGSYTPGQQVQPTPSLSIFQNGAWRQVLAPAAGNLQTNPSGASGFQDVSALAVNDVYIAGIPGLFRYDGTAIARVNNIADTLYAVATTTTAVGGKLVLATGSGGKAWIGYGQSWVQSKAPTTALLDAACITGPSEAFASSTVTGEIFRFDGSNWLALPRPSFFAQELQCPGPGQIFMQGNATQRYRWTGTSWTVFPVPPVTQSLSDTPRWAFVSATDIYAVIDSAFVKRIFFHYDGTAWKEVARKSYAVGLGRAWADPRGGGAYAISALSGRVEKITTTSVSVLSYQPWMRDVVMPSPTSAFAVGYRMFLARWNGASWAVDAPPANTNSQNTLNGVWSDGSKNAWAVGYQSAILRYDGSSWSVVSDKAKPVGPADSYNAVWGSGTDVWVVGDGTIVRCKAVTACGVESSGGGALYGIWGSSATNIFAVGTGGRIMRYNGAAWSQMASPTGRTLSRVAGSGPNDVWAVGDSTLIRFDGTSWTEMPLLGDMQYLKSRVTPASTGIFHLGLWVRSPKEAYLGGDAGQIFRYDGTRWENASRPAVFLRRIMAIAGTSSGCVLAVAEGQSDLPTPTLWRGIGSTGCTNSPMGPPSSWP